MFVTTRPKDLFLPKKRQILKRGRSWKEADLDYNSELCLIDTAWDFFREHCWDLIIFESILYLESLIVFLCLKHVVHSSTWRWVWTRCLGGGIFFLLQRKSISKRVSLFSRYGFFLLYHHLFCPILTYRE